MTVQANRQAPLVPADHLELISRGIAALTVDPYKSTLYYFFPFIKSFFSDSYKLQTAPGVEAMMPQEPTKRILREITDLTRSSQMRREVGCYIGLHHQFSSCGGSFSLTQPALFLPDQHLLRRNGMSAFGAERPDENLRSRLWIFSDDETRFLIARELGQIKDNSGLLKIAIKVSIIAAFFTMCATPLGWPVGASLFALALGLYIVSERYFQIRADCAGVKILGNKTQIAIDTLEKMRQQNLSLREQSRFAKMYITGSGNNILDFTHPFLTSRIERLRSTL